MLQACTICRLPVGNPMETIVRNVSSSASSFFTSSRADKMGNTSADGDMPPPSLLPLLRALRSPSRREPREAKSAAFPINGFPSMHSGAASSHRRCRATAGTPAPAVGKPDFMDRCSHARCADDSGVLRLGSEGVVERGIFIPTAVRGTRTMSGTETTRCSACLPLSCVCVFVADIVVRLTVKLERGGSIAGGAQLGKNHAVGRK